MPTTVTSSIGSAGGRDYSTIAAWEAAAPASLVTADQIWRGECYADSEFTSATTVVTIGGITTDSTRYVHLTAAATQSFQDSGGVRSNALRYNAANGVAIRTTGAYGGPTISANAVGNTRVERLQVSGANTLGPMELDNGTSPNCLVKDCIAVNTKGGAGTSSPTTSIVAIEGDAINVVVHSLGGGRNCIRISSASGRSVIGCTVVTPTDVQAGASGIGVHAFYAPSTIVRSTAMIGMLTCTTTTSTGTFSASSGNNGTNLASGLPGSNNQHSITYSQFTPLTDADKDSLDLRAIASTSLAANGYLDATNAPLDVSLYTRAASPTIGAWELTAAAAAAEMMGQAML